MSRNGFSSTVRAVAREVARASRDAERQARTDAKEKARLHLTNKMEEAEALSREIGERERAVDLLLTQSLLKNPMLDFNAMIKTFMSAKFNDTSWTSIAPREEGFLPEPLGFFARMLPSATRNREQRKAEALHRFEAANVAHNARVAARLQAMNAFEENEQSRKAAIDQDNAMVNELQRGLLAAEHSAVITYFKAVIKKSLRGEPDALSAEIGYSPESRHMVIDLELPEISVVPTETSFKYVKSTDRIEPVARPAAKRKALYASLISQISLKCVDAVFRGGPLGIVDCLTLNGMLDTIDPATGQQVRICLLSVRVTTDNFRTLNLSQVQPEYCLRSLKASVSRAPAELAPVKPLVELDMVDPRFVDTVDVISGLDHRPNLMQLTPNEFENLITNLFSSMGLDTRQTRASRDGGVDCVAFDSRPIFGGKVIIQAKRYKNTVGVSAVRDLFGTTQNEGASKGILVTTSGYGKASFDFARGKPLELLDGGNLLHLLAEHAGIEARIVMPDEWVDLPLHGE